MRVARAPGKAMLFGEYAVLDGAPAIVAAVDRYAIAHVPATDGPSPTPFVAAATKRALARLVDDGITATTRAPIVDSSALYAGDRKLGLGSSAAVTVAAHGAVLTAAGVPLDERKADLFAACNEAHAEAQGARGSGADIAAAVFGGVLAFRVDGQPSPVAWPADLAITFVDTGVAASTAGRVARWRDLSARRPAEHRALRDRLGALAADFLASLGAGRADGLDLVRRWNRALDDLASAIDAEIVTPAHRRIAALADEMGGAAKPSGAGGGDLAVCFAPPDAALPLKKRLAADGFNVLDLAAGAPGLATIELEDLAP